MNGIYRDAEDRLAVLAKTTRVWGGTGTAYEGTRGDVTTGLIELCQDWIKPDMVMAEVGCFAGVSTRVFALFARRVYAVDPWTLAKDYTETPREMIRHAEEQFKAMRGEWPNITTCQNFSVNAAATFPDGSLDAVYIDSEHGRFQEDVRAWTPKLKPTGLLMGHDFDLIGGTWFPGHGVEAVVYPETSWVVRREQLS